MENMSCRCKLIKYTVAQSAKYFKVPLSEMG